MPKRLATRWVRFSSRWAGAIMLFLLCLATVMTIIAASGYIKARDAQRRVNAVEFARAAEARARDIERVSTCFRTAAVRPQVVEIFEAIASQQEFTAKVAIRKLIRAYDASTPTRAKCVRLAVDLDIDPGPYLNAT